MSDSLPSTTPIVDGISELADDYEDAWQEWASSGDAAEWDAATSDGLTA